MRLWAYEVRAYQAGKAWPVVVHHFMAPTRDEALSYYEAHVRNDATLRNCVLGGIGCHAEGAWSVVEYPD